MQGPYGLRIVGTGANAMLLIADAGNNRIVAMTLTGTAISTFGSAGLRQRAVQLAARRGP